MRRDRTVTDKVKTRASEFIHVTFDENSEIRWCVLEKSNVDAMMAGKPKFVVFNGRANRYMDEPLQTRPGELIRLHVVNAGPNHFSAFHVIGTIFDRVYASGNPKNIQYGVQTYALLREEPPVVLKELIDELA